MLPAEPPPAGCPRLLHYACAGSAWLSLHPMRVPPVVTPRLLRLPHRAFRLESGGVHLAAWHVPRENARAGIVLCHGHNNSRLALLPLLRPLHEAGFHLLLFDHRAHGVSGGSLCTYGYREHQDVLAAADWLRREAGVEQVGLLGISMGAASVLLAAEPAGAAAVVSDCAFARLEEMVEQKFFFLPPALREPVGRSVRHWAVRWCGDVLPAVDPEGAVRAWPERPLLVIHGAADRLIPPAHGRRLAAAAPGAEHWEVPGAPHAHSLDCARAEYQRRVTAFFREHLPASVPGR